MMNEELLAKVRAATSAKEIAALAAESGMVLTEDEAQDYYDRVHTTGELSDDELNHVAGGGCGSGSQDGFYGGDRVILLNEKCPSCGATEVRYCSFTIGDKKTGDPGYPFYLSMQCDCGMTFFVKNFGNLTNSMRKA